MIETVFVIVMLSVLAGLGLIGFLIFTFRDAIFYAFEVLAYLLVSLFKTVVQGAVAVIEVTDEWLDDYEIADEPLLRLALIGLVGFLIGVLLVVLQAMVRGQPWVIVTLALAVAFGMILGLAADPEKDWSIGAFPTFHRDGGLKLPLNL